MAAPRLTYKEAIEFLHSLALFGTNLGLETTFQLAKYCGNPQDNLRFIHVAGTNGKGSTCAMLESIYRKAGFKTGLYTSPHLVRFCERIQINRQPIPDDEIARLVSDLKEHLKAFPRETPPTFFEVVTVMALNYFAEQDCDIVIWETGLGGRLDATNIVTPLASVITNIQFDHERWLGNTLAAIATEKAGIIKPGVPVITGAEEPEALEVIRRVAQERNAPLTEIGSNETNVQLLGAHQRKNAALAATTARLLGGPAHAIEAGLREVHWPGRLQLERLAANRTVLLDGAHNLAGVETLAVILETEFKDTPRTLILGILMDKQWREMCARLAPLAEVIYTCPVSSDRTADATALASACATANAKARVKACANVSEALALAQSATFTVISGSLYFIGEAMEELDIASTPSISERALNEWQPKVL